MTTRWWIPTVGFGSVIVLAFGAWLAAQQPTPPPAARAPGTEVGRFQIVNGTPGQAANIMLLDTVTGESWVTCSSQEAGQMWCKQPRSENATGPRR